MMFMDFFQQIQDIIAYTIRSGGNGDSFDAWIMKSAVIVSAQCFYRGIGVSVVLEVGDMVGVRPLVTEELNLCRD